MNYDPAATILESTGVGKIIIDARRDEGAKEVFGWRYPTSVLYADRRLYEGAPGNRPEGRECRSQGAEVNRSERRGEIVAHLPEPSSLATATLYLEPSSNAKPIFSVDGKFNLDDLKRR